jgi:hypothetical protein
MPIEIIFPSNEAGGYEFFQEKVLTINAARNNNAELTRETRANKLGYYAEIKENLDHELVTQVEWKANDGGRVKVRDLVALSLIPLSLTGRTSTDQVRRSPQVIFSSKGQCVKLYDELMEENGVTQEVKGNIVEIVDPTIKSALAMMKDLPRLFDLIYETMPGAYNQAGGKFGKIDGVEKRAAKTRFYRKACDYSYGEGFIYPLVYGLTALMRLKDGRVSWITDPYRFVGEHLTGILRSRATGSSSINGRPITAIRSPGAPRSWP